MPYENAHAAKINDSGIVEQVIVVPYMDDDDEKITAYCNSIGIEGTWIDTSYLGARRKFYAAEGYYFDSERDEFVPPGFELIDGEWVDPPQPDETV